MVDDIEAQEIFGTFSGSISSSRLLIPKDFINYFNNTAVKP